MLSMFLSADIQDLTRLAKLGMQASAKIEMLNRRVARPAAHLSTAARGCPETPVPQRWVGSVQCSSESSESLQGNPSTQPGAGPPGPISASGRIREVGKGEAFLLHLCGAKTKARTVNARLPSSCDYFLL